MSQPLTRLSGVLIRTIGLKKHHSILSSAKSPTKMGNFFTARSASSSNPSQPGASADNEFRKLSEAEWRQRLTKEQFQVCRQKGTEPAFTGEYVDNKQKGVYNCVACGAPLFESETKYDSGSGWPSFYKTYEGQGGSETVVSKADNTLGMRRTEVVCAQCDSHLGHVFPDGPAPTGMRYCINSVSLKFDPNKGDKL